MKISITIDKQSYTYNATPEQIAGLGAARVKALTDLPPGEDQYSDTPISDRPGYIADDVAYLQNVIERSPYRGAEIAPTIERCLNSWAGIVPTPEQVEAVPLSEEARKTALAAYAAAKRYTVMCQGVLINGLRIPGDDTVDSRLRRARASIIDGTVEEPVTFVLGLTKVLADRNLFTAVINALAVRTQRCFAIQGDLVGGINAGTITTTEQIETADWPN